VAAGIGTLIVRGLMRRAKSGAPPPNV
jgi:hypothetical protein